MMRNRKVWGVLGLLLALAFVVGYGRQTICEVSPKFPRNGPCELFIIDMDMHPTRNITYQYQQNVAFFFPDGKGTVFSYFNPPLPPLLLGVRYCFAITF